MVIRLAVIGYSSHHSVSSTAAYTGHRIKINVKALHKDHYLILTAGHKQPVLDWARQYDNNNIKALGR